LLSLKIKWYLLAYADDVNMLEGRVLTVKENTEAVIFPTKETGLGVNADKPKYMIMSRYKNAGRSHNMKIDKVPLKRLESSIIWEQR
jgi:hypothetical protein